MTGKAGDVGEITVLKSQPRSEDALQMLRKIHSLVKPIMKKHGWHLSVLAEFFPKQTNLLGINVNRGAKICIRLRPAHDPNSFLPLEEILIGTMLHELSHNTRGPHDAVFYKQLDELQDEYDELRRKGYEGEGFLGKGNRVGLGVGHDTGISPAQAREKSLKKLEEKDKLRRLLGMGGKLGGAVPDMKGKRMSDIIAEAAERRARDAKTCGGGHSHDGVGASGSKEEDLPPEIRREIELAAKDGRTVVIDLTSDDSDSDVPPARAAKAKQRQPNASLPPPPRESEDSDSDIEIISPVPSKRPFPASFSKPARPKASTSTSQPPKKRPQPPRSTLPAASSSSSASSYSTTPTPSWICQACTFNNLSPLSLACEVCLTERPAVASSSSAQTRPKPVPKTVVVEEGWYCECGCLMEHQFWVCRVCGSVKKNS